LDPTEVSLSSASRRQLEELLEHAFSDVALLARALTHSSRAHEEGDAIGGNERLEFLGDAVLDLVTSELLMRRRPDAREGALSRARAAAVNQAALAECAHRLDLGRHVRLGRGEEQSGGREKPSILANVFEALLGALYLDGGLPAAARFIERHVGPALDSKRTVTDAKTRLQELLQRRGLAAPEYALIRSEGPDHAREFSVQVQSGDDVLGKGSGRSKRAAEQAAARAALSLLPE